MPNAKRDENRVPTLIGVSSVDGVTPTLVAVDPSTNRLLVDVTGSIVESGYSATSTTSLAIGTGAKSLTTQTALAYTAGSRARLSSVANTANYMEGIVSAYTSGTGAMDITIDNVGGSGTKTDWNINVAGDKGVAATATAGTTTTGAPGSSASVVNSGSTSAAVFDFTIPRGDVGATGLTGPIGMAWHGTYDAGHPYVVNDGVAYLGTSYICIQNGTGQTPAITGTAYWSVLALKGTDGAGGDVFLDQTTPQTFINGRPIFGEGIQFDTTPTVGDFSEGKLYYDALWKCLSVDVDTDVTIQIGEETTAFCKNVTGTPITNGQVVYITGADGGYPTIGLADATDINKSFVLGVVTTASIANGGYGHVTIRGNVNGLNTNAWTVGTSLYLGATAGELTSTAPSAGQYDVRVGRVMIQNSTTGRVYVNIRPLNNLTDLGDVTITSPLTDQVLRYNGTEWVNGSAGAVSAGNGVEFFYDGTDIIAIGNDNANKVETLSKTPSQLAETVETTVVNANTILSDIYLYDTALGRTSIDSGVWTFESYCAVSSATLVSEVLHNVMRVRPFAGTVTITDGASATEKIVTASTGTPFAAVELDVGGTIDTDSFLRTPKGVYRITERTDNTHIKILVPSTYTNESTVAFSVHKRLFQVTTGEINNTATSPLFAGLQLYSTNSVQVAYTTLATDKLAIYRFSKTTRGSNTDIYFSYGGTTRYSHLNSPLVTLHNNLAGLQGGTGSGVTGEFNHLTNAQLAALHGVNDANTTSNSYADGKVEDNITDGHTTIAPSGNAVYDALAGKQATLTFGIADTNKVQINAADVADNDYAKFTATGLEGRSYSEVLSDIGAAATAQTFYIGTTQVAINRGTGALTLAGITLTTPDIGTPSAGTLTNCSGYANDINLPKGKQINLTLPDTDATATGSVTSSFNAGYSSAVGDLVFFGTGGKWLEVDADAIATCVGLLGIALEAKTNGQAMKVALPGSFVHIDAWNMTVGAVQYAGETLGAIQEAIPTGANGVIRVVGFALDADTLAFFPSSDNQTTVA